MILISDIHGCYNTLRRLLRKCPDEPVVFCGDLVDRGPDSAGVVRFAMEQAIPTVAGNHEDLMLFYHGRISGYEPGLWEYNGGGTALASWRGKVPAEVLDWVAALPLQLDYGELLISHTGVGNSSGGRMDALWARDVEFPEDERFRVFGHTPSRFCLLAPNWARIDTGATYGAKGFGVMSALQWPQMRVFAQQYDESALEPVITVGKAA